MSQAMCGNHWQLADGRLFCCIKPLGHEGCHESGAIVDCTELAQPTPRPTPEPPQRSLLDKMTGIVPRICACSHYESAHSPNIRKCLVERCLCDAFAEAKTPAPVALCADCGRPKNDSGMHFEAPGTNWASSLHHFRTTAAPTATGAPQFADTYPIAKAFIDKYAPGELGAINALAELLRTRDQAAQERLRAEVRAERTKEIASEMEATAKTCSAKNDAALLRDYSRRLRDQLGKG